MGWVEVLIDKEALKNNLQLIRKKIGNAKLYAVVKSDAYGHGMVECSKLFLESGADALAVATVDEVCTLKDAGVESSVLLLSGFLPGEEQVITELENIEVAITDYWMIEALEKACARSGRTVKVHVKVDTGMGRLGFMPEEMGLVVERILNSRCLRFSGVMSHFPVADILDEVSRDFTKTQIECFRRLLERFALNSCVIHIANSAGVLFYPESIFTGVRVGIALYGGIEYEGLKEAMHVRTRLISVKEVPAGWGISYGRTFIAPKRMRIGVIPFGYALGYKRSLSGKAPVVVNNRKTEVLGRICMDLTVIDLTGIEASPGDYVYVLGGEDERVTVFELSKACNTITYEIFCNFGGEYKKNRRYI